MARKLLLVLIGLAITLVLAVIVYLKLADLSGWSGAIARTASERIGREVTIGRFQADTGVVTRLVVEDVALANPSWSKSPVMAHADRLEISLRLWSLFSPPIRIHEIRLQGATLLLETEPQGRGNWQFPDAVTGDTEILVEAFELANAELGFRAQSGEEPFEVSVERVQVSLSKAGGLDLDAGGSHRGTPFELTGSVGPLEGLLEAGAIEQALTGRIGDVELALHGTIADLATLADPDLEIEIIGPDVAAVTQMLDLPSLGVGPFRVSGEVSPQESRGASGGVPGGASSGPLDLRLDAAIGDVEMHAEGQVSSLRDPRDLDLTISAQGPDPAALGPLGGIDSLPSGSFAVSGNVRLSDSGATFERFTARLGDHRLALDGALSSAPGGSGSEITIEAEGRDLSTFSTVAGLDLPARSYQVRGHLVRRQGDLAADDFEVRIGTTRVWLDGTVGSLPSFEGAELDLRLVSPEPATFEALAGFPLPSEPVEIEGHLGHRPGSVKLESVVLSAAGSEVRLDGVLRPKPPFAGTDLEIRAAGRDLARVAALVPADLPELPAERYEIAGRLRALGAEGYELDAVEGSLGEDLLRVDGRLGARPDLAGTDVRFRITGPDLSGPGVIVGFPGLPVEPYELTGRVSVASDGYELEDVVAKAGEVELRAAGRLGPLPDLDATDLEVEARGPRLSDLAAYRELPPLPVDAFTVAGRVRIDGGIYRLDEISGELGGHHATASGAVGPFPGMEATDLILSSGGIDAREAGQFLSQAGLDWFPELPPDRYALSGRLRLVELDYRLSDVVFTLGGIEGRAEASLASFARAAGMELTADVRGPDASVVGAVAGIQVPAQPFGASGRVELLATETRFHGVRAELGDHRVEVDGTLGKPPRLVGTRLDVHAEGPDTSVLAELLDRPEWLPDRPYEVAGHLEGSPESFLVEQLRARFGPSDLAGSLRVDLRDKPDLRFELRSERLDLPTLLGIEEPPVAGAGAGEAGAPVMEESFGGEPGLVIGDEPFKLAALQKVNAEVLYVAEEVTGRAGTLHDIEMSARLRDGRLQIGRSTMVGEHSGSLSMGLTLEPVADGYRLLARMNGSGIRSPGLTPGQDLEVAVPLDFALSIDGSGDSPHAVARGLDGHLIVALGKGKIDLTFFELVAARLPVAGELLRLAGAFNPLRGSSDYTGIECAVMVARIEDGILELDPVTSRFEYLEVHGVGRVDLETEELAFRWATKPRGLRVGLASAADSFVKIGGTLAAPEVESKPLEAATATGLAIGTAGLSLAADGLFKRLTADRKLCKKALKVAKQALDEVDRRDAE